MAGTLDESLVLDRDVRNWVLLPLTAFVLLLQLLRQYASVLMMGGKPSEPPKAQEVRERAVLARAAALRANGGALTPAGFAARRAYLADAPGGVLHEPASKPDMQEAMMQNPDAFSGVMKQQFAGLVPQLAGGAFVRHFYSGFILGRLPFRLSPKFRAMVQSGIDLPSLEVSYVTSLSFYVLLLFGLRGVMTLAFRDAAINDAAVLSQMQAGGAGAPMGFDAQKAYAAERRALELAQHRWRGPRAEAAAAEALRRRLGR